MFLESVTHVANSFVTLTYEDKHLPTGATLVPGDVQGWLKRLRARTLEKFRFFLSGEYGSLGERPHYHAILFGFEGCKNVRTYKNIPCCDRCELVKETWGKGRIDVAPAEEGSMAYVAGYVAKKKGHTVDWLAGRHPEFTRMSLKPGIGAPAMPEISKALQMDVCDDFLARFGDVPFQLRSGRSGVTLGRYLRGVLRKDLGWKKETPGPALQAFEEEMRTLLKETQAGRQPNKGERVREFLKRLVLEKDVQRIRNTKSRSAIFMPGRSL